MEQTAGLLKALSEKTRLRILLLLIEGEFCVCDITDVLNLPQSTVSRHLACLKKSGWVEDRKAGLWTYYRISGRNHPIQSKLLEILKENISSLKSAKEDLNRLKRHKHNEKTPEKCA